MRLIVGGIYQGREKYARDKYGKDVTVYRDIFDDLCKGYSYETVLNKAVISDVVIAEEAFGGLFITDEKDRKLNEEYGRLLIELSSRADSVERIVCGLAMSLK